MIVYLVPQDNGDPVFTRESPGAAASIEVTDIHNGSDGTWVEFENDHIYPHEIVVMINGGDIPCVIIDEEKAQEMMILVS